MKQTTIQIIAAKRAKPIRKSICEHNASLYKELDESVSTDLLNYALLWAYTEGMKTIIGQMGGKLLPPKN
jgi:hypothetical protein